MTPEKKVGTTQARVLTAADIFKGPENKPLPLKDMDGIVYIKPPSAGSVLAFTEQKEGRARNESLLKLIAEGVVDEKGDPLFDDSVAVEDLKKMSISVFNELATAVSSLAEEGVEETEGNG